MESVLCPTGFSQSSSHLEHWVYFTLIRFFHARFSHVFLCALVPVLSLVILRWKTEETELNWWLDTNGCPGTHAHAACMLSRMERKRPCKFLLSAPWSEVADLVGTTFKILPNIPPLSPSLPPDHCYGCKYTRPSQLPFAKETLFPTPSPPYLPWFFSLALLTNQHT